MSEFRAKHDRVLNALILTDGKMGDLAQCRGITSQLGMLATETTINPSPLRAAFGLGGRENTFQNALAAWEKPPTLIIASGRKTVPYLKAARRYFGPQPLSVFLKDPRTGLATADLIWVPSHDTLRGPNVIDTPTGPHGHNAEKRQLAGQALADDLDGKTLPQPWLGVLLGGATKKVPYDRHTISALKAAITTATQNAGSLLITPSRRTPERLLHDLDDLPVPTWIWNGQGTNPYTGMLGRCDAFFVTGDSHNMVSEALVAGKHTMVFRPSGLPPKFGRFLDKMEEQGVITPPQIANFEHKQPSIDATGVIAETIWQAIEPRLSPDFRG